MAVEECGGLLDDSGLCTVCVSPHIQVDAGALKVARVGGAVALPVSIANASVVGRPIFVTRVWSREGTSDWQEVRLAWERLDAGQSRPVSIIANQLNHAGAHSIEILVEVSTRWRWREERYVFSASLRLHVKGEDKSVGPTVTIGGDEAGHGNAVFIAGNRGSATELETTAEAFDLEMVRAEVEERRLGVRGTEDGVCLPRGVPFVWQGFAPECVPQDGPISSEDGSLVVGRARSRRAGGTGDVRLLAESPAGSIDENLSRLISRRHFELYIERDRLMARVSGSGGIRIDGDAYGPGKTIVLNDGTRIDPIVKSSNAVTLKVGFQTEHNRVTQVTIERQTVDGQGD